MTHITTAAHRDGPRAPVVTVTGGLDGCVLRLDGHVLRAEMTQEQAAQALREARQASRDAPAMLAAALAKTSERGA